jgi:23S rRNA (guanosine2251-2'-O)-methyltransferase
MNNDFLYGINPVVEALNERKPIDKILLKKGKLDEQAKFIKAESKKLDIPCFSVPQEKLDRITRKNHQGCIALISPIEFHKVADIIPQIYEKGEMPLLMILDGLTDVRNVGAIARTCLSAGFHALVIPKNKFARIGPDALKTSAGALLKLPVCREENLSHTVHFLQESGVQVIAATEKAEDVYFNADYNMPTAIVMGAEDEGVSDQLLRKVDLMMKIPMQNEFDSLNVSVAAGVLSFEAVKQRLSQE